MPIRGRVRRTRRGAFELRIPPEERDLLRTLPEQLRQLLAEADPVEDPAMRRLYPAAYLDDPDATREFDAIVRDDLTAERLRAIDTMAGTIDARSLSEDELAAWLAAINDVRLVLGVRLLVTEESEPDDFAGGPDEAAYATYHYLSYLEEEVVDALSSGPIGPSDPGRPSPD
jgi:Domain of unknown function (DUF2017)